MYQALYRKYRPQTFDDVAGQTSVTQTLRNQVITGKLSHAYLFTGSRGTGKTTCAKILAKAVNCENPIDGNPCNCCASCRGIDSGAVMDVQEIDAASNNGVDNVRSIRDEAVYPPVEVKKRVYIIDEVHMLSTAAFNALLKILEEPPEHLMFILATTELQKVPATILSRCQRYAFRRPTAEDITGRIRYVAYQEGIDLEPDAAELLGRLADGAFRDGLSLLDQCASAAVGTLTVDHIYQTLGLAGQQQTLELMTAIADRNAGRALQLFSELYSAGKDAAALLGELSTLARDLLILKTAPKSGIGMISSVCTGGRGALPDPSVPAGAESGRQRPFRPDRPGGGRAFRQAGSAGAAAAERPVYRCVRAGSLCAGIRSGTGAAVPGGGACSGPGSRLRRYLAHHCGKSQTGAGAHGPSVSGSADRQVPRDRSASDARKRNDAGPCKQDGGYGDPAGKRLRGHGPSHPGDPGGARRLRQRNRQPAPAQGAVRRTGQHHI